MVTTRACTRAATVSSKAVRAKAAAPAGRRPKAAALKVKPSASRRSSAARSRSSLCVSPVDSPGQARAASLAAASPAADNPLRALEIIMVQQKGCQVVVGVDEAGRGPLAGPVVAAACHVPADVSIPGVNDSKKLSEQQREELYELIVAHPRVMWAVAEVSPGRIDEINILQATMECMRAAVHGLSAKHGMPDCVLIDGNRLPWGNVAGKRANGTIRPADPAKPSEIKELHAVVKGDASRWRDCHLMAPPVYLY